MIPHSAPSLRDADHQAVSRVLSSGMIASGEVAQDFASAVCARVGAQEAETAASGMDAISGALRALGISPGDDVIVPTYVCGRVQTAVENVGARAILADVGEDGNLTAETVDAARTSATRAIVAVHIFGHPCDIAALRQSGIPVVEDACQAFAVRFPAGMSGTLGDAGTFSFQATKCLASGEGGMIVWGADSSRKSASGVSEMGDLNAALGMAQLARYDEFLERRTAIAHDYSDAASGRAQLIAHLPDASMPLFRYTLRSNRGFDHAQDFFAERGIAARRGVDRLLHRSAGQDDSRFPMATRLFDTTVSLPCYPALADADRVRVCDAISEFANVH